jgi:threonine dehydratase
LPVEGRDEVRKFPVQALSETEAARGVATHSSGNHGQALALAARIRGIRCHVVMPHNSVPSKVAAVRDFGAEIIFCEPNHDARESNLIEVVARTGAHVVHPYENPYVIAGQGTACLELLQEHPELDIVLTPVGGGGLLCGSAIAAHAHNKKIRVIAAEPENGCDAFDSMRLGKLVTGYSPNTICDGLRAGIGQINFDLMQAHSVEVLLVSEEEVINAMRFVWERVKIIIEPSCATVVAALKRYPQHFAGQRIGLIFSGGNVDLDQLPWLKT